MINPISPSGIVYNHLRNTSMQKCKFYNDWSGPCDTPCEKDYCEEHKNTKCEVCEKQATHTCSETMGAFVCGVPLCEKCKCTFNH